MKRILLSTIAALAVTTAAPVLAQSAGDWTIGIGVINVNPDSDNGSISGGGPDFEIGSDTQLSLTAEYFFTSNIGLEILAATPFTHDVGVEGLGNIGETSHLPPTVSVNYHFTQFAGFKPYVGVGINYTNFFEESSSLGKLELDDSFGLAVQVGVDIPVWERGALRLNARYIDIETDAKLNGTDIGTVTIDPVVLNLAYVLSF
jgi:outer membrane protein